MTVDRDEAIAEVAKWRDATKTIPVMVREDIAKGNYKPADPSKGFKALLEDPLAIQYSMGYKDRNHSISYDMARHVVRNLSLLGSIINTRVAQVAAFAQPFRLSGSVGFVVKHKDPAKVTTKGDREMIKSIEAFMYNCGADKPNPHNDQDNVRDDFETTLRKLVRDSMTFDQTVIETVNDRRGLPYEFRAVDAATIRIAAKVESQNENHASIFGYADQQKFVHSSNPYNRLNTFMRDPSKEAPAYVQLVNGQLYRAFSRKELAVGIRNPRTDIYVQGYGQCLHPDTRVETSSGFTPIKALVNQEFKVAINGKLIDATAFSTGEKEVFEVVFEDGRSVRASKDHRFYVLNDTGHFEWRVLSELKPGDTLASSITPVEINQDPSNFAFSFIPQENERAQAWEFDGALTPEICEMLGWLVADGSFNRKPSSYSISFCYEKEKEKWILDRHHKVLASMGMNFSTYNYDYVSTYELKVTNKPFGMWLEKLGFTPSSKTAKPNCLPEFVFKLDKANRRGFLRGLFSADGHLNGVATPMLGCTDRGLLSDTQKLLWSLGIRSKWTHGKVEKDMGTGLQEYDDGRLYVYDNVEFFEDIGFLHNHKQPNLSNLQGTRIDCVGAPFATRAAAELRGQFKSGTTPYRRCTGLLQNPPRWGVTRKWLKSHGATGALMDDLSWHQGTVLSVHTTGELEEMYDVEVQDDFHGFCVDGGVVVHNSEIEQLITIITAHLYAEEYNRRFFMNGSAPKGILSIKGDVMDPEQMEGFKRNWEANVAGTANAWKTPIIQSEAGLDWINMNPSNRDMEYGQWVEYLIKIITGVFMCDPAELNFDLGGGVSQTPLFESSSEWKLKASRDRGLKPLLRFFSKFFNDNIVSRIDDNFIFEFVGLDELTEQEKLELHKEQLSSYKTLNEIRRADDLPDVEHGNYVLNPTYIQAMQVSQQMEQAKQQMDQQAQQAQGAPQSQEQGDADGDGAQDQDEGIPDYASQFVKSMVQAPQILEIQMDDYDTWLDVWKA